MATWRFNRKAFIRRQRMMMLANANECFCVFKTKLSLNAFFNLVDECERMNEDLRQGQRTSIDINVNDLTDDALGSLNDVSNDVLGYSNNESPIHSIDCSAASFKSQAVDEPYISEDEPNAYVIYSNFFFFIIGIFESWFFSILIKNGPIFSVKTNCLSEKSYWSS